LDVINYRDIIYTDEQNRILERFAKVFEQSYTRFLDLQKAEAQTREVQIELGLERVRARAMAMQRSDELKELIGAVSIELAKLDIVLDRCFIITYNTQTLDSTWWMANPETPSEPIGVFVKYHEYAPYLAHVDAWKQRNVKWEYILEGEIKKTWDLFLFSQTGLSQLPRSVIENMRSKEKVYLSSSFNNFGYLTLATLEPLSDEQFDIMLRFAKVFDLTYTRFNDLKQAEAQAEKQKYNWHWKECTTMAMQKSEELPETTFLLFQQLKGLGEAAAQLSIGIFKEEEGYVELSTTILGNPLLQTYQVPIEPYMKAAVKAWKERQKSLTIEIGGPELKDYNAWRNSVLKTKIDFPEDRWVINMVFFSKGMMSFSSNDQISKDAFELLERFTGVFDLTYTRFLDLKNAEAQARESQIQLALERVRARTMAMQKSDELAEAAQVLYEEFRTLHINTFTCGYLFIKESQHKQTAWVTTPDGTIVPDFIDFPLTGDHVLDKRYEDWKQKKPLHVFEIQGEANKEHHRFLASEVPDQIANEIFAQIPERIIFYCANFSAGYLFIIATEFLSSEKSRSSSALQKFLS
jgi:hypothetical protein